MSITHNVAIKLILTFNLILKIQDITLLSDISRSILRVVRSSDLNRVMKEERGIGEKEENKSNLFLPLI